MYPALLLSLVVLNSRATPACPTGIIFSRRGRDTVVHERPRLEYTLNWHPVHRNPPDTNPLDANPRKQPPPGDGKRPCGMIESKRKILRK